MSANADVWEALLAVADLAGPRWAERARVAAVTLVTDAADRRQTFGVQLLGDLRQVFGSASSMPTEDILTALHSMEDAPWGDLRGQPLSARDLSRRLGKYSSGDEADTPIRPTTIRDGDRVFKGYRRADLLDAWARYLPVRPPVTVTSVTTVTDTLPSVTPVTAVTDPAPGTGAQPASTSTPEPCRLHPTIPKPNACYTCAENAGQGWDA